ncbi:MAG TPA: NAD(P)H-hydrate epimerase [Planctomycetaceae bacterium]|nr:NAD(P)H-hydrate epimerase [Planctomycetaceae bacterium]
MTTKSVPHPLTRQQVRDVDRRAIAEYGLPGVVLMENAGRGAAELLVRLGASGRIVICAGKGNNGGDGFVIARHLGFSEIQTSVLLFCQPEDLTGDAALNYRVLAKAGQEMIVMGAAPDVARLDRHLAAADWIVDALLGTGTQGAIREPYLTAIAAINRSGKKVLAVDLPSGMDCDTGQSLGACVRADHTATFVARKVGFDAPAAAPFTGQVHVIDIGVPRRLLTDIAAE